MVTRSIACADAWPGLIEECARALQAVRPTSKVMMVQKQGCQEVLSYLGVEWRFSCPDVISVAKKDAVALLGAFVGPKY